MGVPTKVLFTGLLGLGDDFDDTRFELDNRRNVM
jgi:hypothetical protein